VVGSGRTWWLCAGRGEVERLWWGSIAVGGCNGWDKGGCTGLDM
jgi:hypothetical protein